MTSGSTSASADRPVRRRQRLSTPIADELLRRVVSGAYPVGTQLPPEPVLVVEFDVSRTVIREAVKSLEAAGLVSIRQGDGTVVRDRGLWSILDPRVLPVALTYDIGSRLADDAIALRAELDTTLITEAAPKLTEGDFATMDECLHVMDASSELADLQRADLAFHRVYRARSGNELKSSIVMLLMEEMPPNERLVREPRAMYDAANLDHWDIYNALRDGRVEDAVVALDRHIRDLWTWRHDTP
ncbi:FadR/GntR family transcriptional regulator [Microbacterium sp. ASV49]|uniref:GntR family transcriptional regulator n=1 Tax=Microbacterium candidum TaxID=3041922 RepID=A0ABT7MTL7_9MICO|nr:GntR family transcriptional regulator [Microbacterium sp. ASV49]MDL9977796.1 GntR family transcriptional regulator [Microbacterium sp. ASV49]